MSLSMSHLQNNLQKLYIAMVATVQSGFSIHVAAVTGYTVLEIKH